MQLNTCCLPPKAEDTLNVIESHPVNLCSCFASTW